jgi:hypothetical protein
MPREPPVINTTLPANSPEANYEPPESPRPRPGGDTESTFPMISAPTPMREPACMPGLRTVRRCVERADRVNHIVDVVIRQTRVHRQR